MFSLFRSGVDNPQSQKRSMRNINYVILFTFFVVMGVIILIYFDTVTLRPRKLINKVVTLETDDHLVVMHKEDGTPKDHFELQGVTSESLDDERMISRWQVSMVAIYVVNAQFTVVYDSHDNNERTSDVVFCPVERQDASGNTTICGPGHGNGDECIIWDDDDQVWKMTPLFDVHTDVRNDKSRSSDFKQVRNVDSKDQIGIYKSLSTDNGVFQIIPKFGSKRSAYIYSRKQQKYMWMDPSSKEIRMNSTKKSLFSLGNAQC